MGTSADNVNISVDISLNLDLAGDLLERAAELGISLDELLIDLIVTGFRATDMQRNYPTFTVPINNEKDFVDDGFRVVKRDASHVTLCPYNGVSFKDASDALAAVLNSDETATRFTEIL